MATSSPSIASSTGSASVLELDLHSPLRPSTTTSSSAAAPGGLSPTMPSWTSTTPANRARMRTRSFDFRSPVLGPTSASPSAAGSRGQPGSPSPSPATKAARSAARSDFERDLAQTFGFEHAREGDDFAGHYVGFAGKNTGFAGKNACSAGKNAGSAGKGAGPGPAAGQGASAIKHAVDGGLFSPDRVQTYTSSPPSKATATVDRSRERRRTRTHTYTLTVATMQQWLPHAFVDESSEGGVPLPSAQSTVSTHRFATTTALRVPELLSLVFDHLPSSPGTLAAALRVSRSWFAAAAPVLWQSVAFEVCGRLFEMAHLVDTGGKWGRKERQYIRDVFPMPEGTADRHEVYTGAVQAVHITEVAHPGESVDVMILRRKYPAMAPFINLRRVHLHRLSPHARYAEEFTYEVKYPEMWLDLTSTACAHRLDVLSTSTDSADTRHLHVSARDRTMATEAMAAIDRSNETDGFVWIQTSVFLHYQFLRRFSLEMPPSWQLDRRHASDLLRAIATSSNRAHIEELKCSPPLPVLDPVLASPTVDERGIALAPARLVIPAGSALLLFSLHALTTVELECAFTDVHIAFLVKSWPHLRSFVLRSPALIYLDRAEAQTTGAHFVSRPTISALAVLATHCPQLEHLEMDLEPLPVAELLDFRSVIHHCPIFGPRLARLSITGWTNPVAYVGKHKDVSQARARFLVVFACRAVPPTCRLDLPVVALGGLTDLFVRFADDSLLAAGQQEQQWKAMLARWTQHDLFRRLAWPGQQGNSPSEA